VGELLEVGAPARVEALLGVIGELLSALDGLRHQLRAELSGDEAGAGVGKLPASEALEQLRLENQQLKQALEGRGLIERAKGLLMAACGCDEATAFRLLTDRSRREHRKVREVAESVVAEAALSRGALR
jgi:hypothetical protein